MIVWHSSLIAPSPVGGLEPVVSRLCSSLADLGHTVVRLVPSNEPLATASDSTQPNHIMARLPFRAHMYAPRALDELAERYEPDVVHLHWAFRPYNSRLAMWATAHGVPYVLHPHGALAHQGLRRHGLRKRVYLKTIEHRTLQAAAATIGNTQGDVEDLLRLNRASGRLNRVIPNALVTRAEFEHAATFVVRRKPRPGGRYRCIYLGRWDVENKGLDRLVAIAQQTDRASFHFHTDAKASGRREDRLLRALPPNVTIETPVYGQDKWNALRSADAYVQLSRWESFGNSVAEAVVARLPVFLSAEMHLARQLGPQGACEILPADSPTDAAHRLMQVLDDVDRVTAIVAAGRSFAQSVIDSVVAARVDALYRAIT